MHRPFKKLSLGNRTKTCLVMALAQGAELLILDEPVSRLNPVIIDQLRQLIIEDYASDGRTDSSNPSFNSSPWIRGAPHRGLTRLICGSDR